MPTSRLGKKGQVVVPREIRELLGLEPGDRIDFVVEKDGRVYRAIRRRDGRTSGGGSIGR